jgi:AcrR family transcriptional regulator
MSESLVDEPVDVDGRNLRRQRNRTAVVDALLDLYTDGVLRPRSVEIAGRAGLSPRSIFRYFDDVDDLSRAAIDRQLERAAPLLVIAASADAPLVDRIGALVAQRSVLFGATAPSATVIRLQAPFQPVLEAQLGRSRAFLRSQVRRLFEPELSGMDGNGVATLSAIDVLCSFESYRLLRQDQGLSEPEAEATLAQALATLLAGASG